MASPTRTVIVVTAFTVISLLSASVGIAQEGNYLIAPGQRVGRWELGKPVEAYSFGQPQGRWEGKTDKGVPYFDGFTFLLGAGSSQELHVDLHACKNDAVVFAIYVIRRTNLPPQAQS